MQILSNYILYGYADEPSRCGEKKIAAIFARVFRAATIRASRLISLKICTNIFTTVGAFANRFAVFPMMTH